MRILFDQGTPVPIRLYLEGHPLITGFQQRWDKLRNGELLAVAEQAGFDLFVTTDRNLSYQHNLASRTIAIIVLGQQQWPGARPHVQRVVQAVFSLTPGSFVEVEIPFR